MFYFDGNYSFIKKNISKSAKNIETEDGKILGSIMEFMTLQLAKKGIGVGGVSGKKKSPTFLCHRYQYKVIK